MNPEHGSRSTSIPISRAYWELKAEQVMNRVFPPPAAIDLEIVETQTPSIASPASPPARPPSSAQAAPAPTDRRLLLAAGLGLLGLGLAGGAAAGWGLWLQHQQALRQERNLLLIERLRSLTPGEAMGQANPAASAAGSSGGGPELPPPPPEEPWMQELATLPSSSAPPARVLKVPMNQAIGAAAPPARGGGGLGSAAPRGASPAASGPLPQLVGVIQVPGSGGSAIFQVAGSSTSAAIGEPIGNSGWRLQAASGDTAVIERSGEQRRLSISSGF